MTNIKKLQQNQIDIWFVQDRRIEQSELLARYAALLTPDELERQQRYRFAKDRHSALITRALVRTVLSQYAAVQPQDWRFIKGEKDKPEIVNPPLPLRFNLSHTENLIVCAVGLEHDLGIDVEYIPRNNDILAIADRYFSPSEVKELFSLPEEEQRSRFFDYWTLKESYIKACGLGLAIPLDHFSFHIGDKTNPWLNNDISLSFVPERNDDPKHWQSRVFYPHPDYRIAISVRDGQTAPLDIRWHACTPLVSYQEKQLEYLDLH